MGPESEVGVPWDISCECISAETSEYIVFLCCWVGRLWTWTVPTLQKSMFMSIEHWRFTVLITLCTCLSLVERDGELWCATPQFSLGLPLPLPRKKGDYPKSESRLEHFPLKNTHLDFTPEFPVRYFNKLYGWYMWGGKLGLLYLHLWSRQ